MADNTMITRFTLAVSAGLLSLTLMSLGSGAMPLAVPGAFVLLSLWAAYLLIYKPHAQDPHYHKNREERKARQIYVHVMTSLCLIYGIWFGCLTGGGYSPGMLLLFFVPVSGVLTRSKKAFLIYCGLSGGALAFFILGPPWGPGALNLNALRPVFMGICFAAFGLSLFLILGQLCEADRERESSHDELNRVTEDARTALEVKDRFLANMSHEIRNPMNGIIGMMHVLMDSDLDDEQQRHAGIVYNSANALLSIVNDILDLSKIEAGRLELDIRSFDLEIAVKDIVSLPEVMARQKGLEFSYSIDSEVPVLLKGDIGRIRQIILNLTGNAIKFTEQGSVGLDISLISDEEQRAFLRFSVDDTGIGIKEETLNELFAPFVQADASITKAYGGTGLGLSISKLLVEKMGGSIGAESIEMIGSTFWFEIPLEKQGREEAAVDLSRIPLSKTRILVTSDADGPGRQLSAALKKSGADFECAPNEKRAVEMIRKAAGGQRPFHVVIMEVQESDLYARALGSRLKADGSPGGVNLNLILVTAVGQKGDARDFEKLGFSAYLSFPLEPQILPDCLRAVSAQTGNGTGGGRPSIITRFTLAECKKQNHRILIVEDMETNLITAKTLIGRQGYRTDEARNGAQAVEKVSDQGYDLVLMDCQMPVMDGYEATRQIRRREAELQLPRMPIIAMTGNAFDKDREACFEAGMDDFISKPVEPDVLNRMLHFHLTRGVVPAKEAPADPETMPLPAEEERPSADLVFDREHLMERFGNDEELVAVVLESFIQEAPELFSKLKNAVDDDNTDEIRSCAHAMKGSAANVNAERVRHIALELEQAAGLGDTGSVPAMTERLEGAFEEFRREAMI